MTPAPDPSIPTVPVICDKCRATGMAGDEAFSAIPDILDFTPVERRAHVNGWRAEHQRAFIAALAITGSPRQAARAIGRHAFGAEQLRTHRGGRSFAAAWDAALELARERETHRIHDNLAELSQQRDAELAQLSPSPPGRERLAGGDAAFSSSGGRAAALHGEGATQIHADCDYDPDLHTDDYPEYWEAKKQVRERMLRARRLLLMLLSSDPAKRAAWEKLCGPVNWDQAANLEAEDGEAYAMTNSRQADLLITAEAGFLPELTGGRDGITEVFAEAFRMQAAGELEEEAD